MQVRFAPKATDNRLGIACRYGPRATFATVAQCPLLPPEVTGLLRCTEWRDGSESAASGRRLP